MVFGELVPKNLAIARPLPTAKATQAFQRGFTSAMAYPIRLLNGTANRIVKALGLEPQEELRSARTAEELSSLVRRSASEGTLDLGTAGLMQRTLAFGGRTAGDIMTPRVRMDAVDAGAPVAEVVATAQRTGHSRFPVIDGDVDEVVGAVHVKHAVSVPPAERGHRPVRSLMVPAIAAPDSLPLDPLLTLLRGEGLQMAVVVDEYGGTAGVVTLEDVVEEIVGEIADEHDRSGSGARGRHDGSWSLSGLLRPDEIAELTGVRLPEHEDYDTVAGLVLSRLGRMAEVGDTVDVALPTDPGSDADDAPAGERPPRAARISVEALDGRRIDQVGLAVVPAADEALPDRARRAGAERRP
jgi:CBS domain containing-hemolysin-like protein